MYNHVQVLQYEETVGTWSKLGKMQKARSYHAVVASGIVGQTYMSQSSLLPSPPPLFTISSSFYPYPMLYPICYHCFQHYNLFNVFKAHSHDMASSDKWLREGINGKKNVFFWALLEWWGGEGLPMPEFFGPFSRSAFWVNKKSLCLQKCQCIELLTVF